MVTAGYAELNYYGCLETRRDIGKWAALWEATCCVYVWCTVHMYSRECLDRDAV
jgi:hypothetical protein